MHWGAQIRFHGEEELIALTDGKQAHDQDSSPGDTTHFNTATNKQSCTRGGDRKRQIHRAALFLVFTAAVFSLHTYDCFL